MFKNCKKLSPRYFKYVVLPELLGVAALGEPLPNLLSVLKLSPYPAGILPLPPDAGDLSSPDVLVTPHVLLSVVNATAPGGDAGVVHHLSPLLTEHGHLVPHPGSRVAVDLHEGLVVEKIRTLEVIVRLAHVAGDAPGQEAEAAQHHQDTQLQVHGIIICIKLYS